MFSFLNSTILFAAAAALIPLIIHLFSRRRRKVIEFSSLRHLKAMQRRQVRRLQIRQLLLLLLRMLIILMVVLAFARPTTKDAEIGAHASVSAVVLFDNSASMARYVQDGVLFDIAQKRTAELLETFNQSDEVVLIPLARADDDPALVFASAAVSQEKLAGLTPGAGAGSFGTALEKAREMLDAAANLNKELYLVTDRQRRLLPEDEVLNETDISVYFVELPIEDTENRAVTGVDFGGQLIQPGHDFDIVATVRNYGGESVEDVIASLSVDGRRVAQNDFSVSAGGETTVRFTHSVQRTGFHSGYIEISDDKFLQDNRYYFSFRIPDRFNLLLINGDPASRFISLALAPTLELNQYWSVKEATPEQLIGMNLYDYDVVVLAGAPALNSSHVERLKGMVRRGKSLFITYGSDTDINSFNTVWSAASGVTFTEPVKENFSRAGYYDIQSLDLNHPIFSVFEFEDNEPPQIKFYTLPQATVSGDADVLMQFSGDRPALVESKFGNGKILTFAGPISPRYTDLPSHGFFVPFVSRTAEYLAADLSTFDVRLMTDQNITRSLSLAGTVQQAVELITPDSSIYTIPPEEQQGALVVRAAPTDDPGIYRILYQSREIDRFAVNMNPAESELTPVDQEQFATAIGVGEEFRPLQSDVALAGAISDYRIGRELWQIFLWIAVGLLAIEMLLGRGAPAKEE